MLKCPKPKVFLHLILLNSLIRFSFKIMSMSVLYPYNTLTSFKISEKTNEQSLRYLKTDQQTAGERTILKI